MLRLYNNEAHDQETHNIGNFEFAGTSVEYIVHAGTWGSLESPDEDTGFTEFGKRFIKVFRNRKIGK